LNEGWSNYGIQMFSQRYVFTLTHTLLSIQSRTKLFSFLHLNGILSLTSCRHKIKYENVLKERLIIYRSIRININVFISTFWIIKYHFFGWDTVTSLKILSIRKKKEKIGYGSPTTKSTIITCFWIFFIRGIGHFSPWM